MKLNQYGFTLIELSIVLVIIGLIVGGILTGRSLIEASRVRATLTQVEAYNQAVNTFLGKYGQLPGDLQPTLAMQFGFQSPSSRAGTAGRGDGNGTLQGYDYANSVPSNFFQSGELAFFWEDLSTAHLIDGTFSTAGDYLYASNSTPVAPLMPQAKIGNGNYLYVYSLSGFNYFGLSVANTVIASGQLDSLPGLTVAQAASIDSKADDGLPQSGRIVAEFISTVNGYWWAGGGGIEGAHTGVYSGSNPGHFPTTAATQGSSTTCYDNNNVTGPELYSLLQSAGQNVNCGLSFRFQ